MKTCFSDPITLFCSRLQQVTDSLGFKDQSKHDGAIKAVSAGSKLKQPESLWGKAERQREAERVHEGEYYHSEWPHLSSGGSIFLSALKSDGESL